MEGGQEAKTMETPASAGVLSDRCQTGPDRDFIGNTNQKAIGICGPSDGEAVVADPT
jgi:hypothetical protein